MGRITPQRDEQLPGDCHDRHALVSLAVAVRASHEPRCDSTVGLEPDPTPGELDKTSPHDSIPSFTDTLFVLQATTAIGARRQTAECRQAPAISKFTTQHLPDKDDGCLASYARELLQRRHLIRPFQLRSSFREFIARLFLQRWLCHCLLDFSDMSQNHLEP